MHNFIAAIITSIAFGTFFRPCNSLESLLPLQRRLLQKARALNPPVSPLEERPTTSYSNRAGFGITPITDDVYTADRPFFWNSIDVSCRCTIVSLGGGEVFVHSPVDFDKQMKESFTNLLASIPDVTKVFVFAPNYEHVKYVPSWFSALKGSGSGDGAAVGAATNFYFLGCPGVTKRVADVVFDAELPLGFRPSAASDLDENCWWDHEKLLALHVDAEINPFTNKAFFNECIFFYEKEGALIVTDLFWNYPTIKGGVNEDLKRRLGGDGDWEGDFGTWDLAPIARVPKTSRAWKFGMVSCR